MVAAAVAAAGRTTIVAVPDRRDLDHLETVLRAGPAAPAVLRLDAGRAAGLGVDRRAVVAEDADGAQRRRRLQQRGIDAQCRRGDQRTRVAQRLAQCARLAPELGRVVHALALLQPLQHLRVQPLDVPDKDVRPGRGEERQAQR